MTDHLPEPLIATLDIVVRAAAGLRDPWWIFGGAAMALAGLEDLSVPDVDILASPRDARALIEALHGDLTDDPGEGLFRSRVFGQILTTPMPVDVMADMDVRDGGDWTAVTFQTRMPVDVDGVTVFIPVVSEQIANCRLFGRPKDLERAARLETLIR